MTKVIAFKICNIGHSVERDYANLVSNRPFTMKLNSVTGTLPHAHVESDAFKEFVHDLVPGYQMKTRRTIKRSILEMYVVLRHQVIDLLSKSQSRFSITFDGWSNSTLKGF